MKPRRATVSERGQVVIPKPLRDRLGIRVGETLEFSEERGRLVARKVVERDPVARVWGVLRLGRGGSDAAVRELRGDPDAV